MRLVLFGDGDSPHLLKWVRALSRQPCIDLWVVSSRGFMAEMDAWVPASQRLALQTRPRAAGGNIGLLLRLPRLALWLRAVRPDWLHAHYLTSHGALSLLGMKVFGVPGRLVGSAWGSDILVTPNRGWVWRWITQQVLRACTLTTSDSQVMATRMRELGAGEVMVFPFGLEALPDAPIGKDPDLVFANRGLEPIYRPQRVLEVFTLMRRLRPSLRLAMANDGSLRSEVEARIQAAGLIDHVQLLGRLDAGSQASWYDRAQWYLSLPSSDSVAVSVLEAMAHGCIPVLSDLPANRELVRHGENGLLLADDESPVAAELALLGQRAQALADDNRHWVREHALFAPAVQAFVERLAALSSP